MYAYKGLLYAYMFSTSVFLLTCFSTSVLCLQVYNLSFAYIFLFLFCFQLLLHLLKTHKLVTYWQFKVCLCVIVIMVQEVNWNRQSESFTFYVISAKIKVFTFYVISVKDFFFLCYNSNCTWKVWNKLNIKFVRMNKKKHKLMNFMKQRMPCGLCRYVSLM